MLFKRFFCLIKFGLTLFILFLALFQLSLQICVLLIVFLDLSFSLCQVLFKIFDFLILLFFFILDNLNYWIQFLKLTFILWWLGCLFLFEWLSMLCGFLQLLFKLFAARFMHCKLFQLLFLFIQKFNVILDFRLLLLNLFLILFFWFF